MRLKKSRLPTAYSASSYSQRNWLCGLHLWLTTMSSVTFKIVNSLFKNIAVRVSQVDTQKDGPCPMEWLCEHFTSSVNTQCIFLSLSRSDFRSVEPTQRKTDRARPYPMESIRQHSTPSVNTSVYFSKSLAIGLPVRRTVAYPRRSDSVRMYWTCMDNLDTITIIYPTNNPSKFTAMITIHFHLQPQYNMNFIYISQNSKCLILHYSGFNFKHCSQLWIFEVWKLHQTYRTFHRHSSLKLSVKIVQFSWNENNSENAKTLNFSSTAAFPWNRSYP